MELIYLGDDVQATVDRILADEELQDCGLTKKNVLQTITSFQGDEIACAVFLRKYALRDKNNQIVEFTLEEAKNRWAKEITSAEKKFPNETVDGQLIEKKNKRYFRELYDHFLPAGRQMFALGNEVLKNITFTNCYVTDIEEDSIEGIYDCAKRLAKTYSYGGGIGTCIGTLRPKKATVSNSARFSTGSVSFMELYSLTTGLIGQCIAEGERVLTNKGLVPIEQVEVGDRVWTKKGFVRVNGVLSNGRKPVFRVKDDLGYEVKATEKHVFCSEENGSLREVRLEELEVGSPIVLIPGTPISKPYVKLDEEIYRKKSFSNKSNRLNESVRIPVVLNEALAYFLGYSYGNGSVEYDKFNEPLNLSLSCADDWPEIKDQLRGIIKQEFNYDVKVKKGDGALENYTIHSKIALHFLKSNGLLKQKAESLVFPEKILASGSSVQMAFIAGLFDADGKKVTKKRGYAISMVPFDFLQQVKHVLMSNGIISRNNFESRGHLGWRDLNGLSIAGTASQTRARELLGMSVKIRDANFISKRDNYLTPYKAKSIGTSHNKYGFVPDDSQFVSASCFQKLRALGVTDEELLIKSTIELIEYDGEAETYDLQLDDEHLFYCEGFYVHNSGRRGALMLTIPVNHPDIEDFVEIKHNNRDKVKHANISVKLTDDFMNAVIEDREFELSFTTPHEKFAKIVRARELWNKIVKSARDSAEPGLMFWDEMVRMSPSNTYERLQVLSTNPCGEQILEKGGACVLSSLLLHTFVKNPYTLEAEFDFDLFAQMTRRGVRHLDNVVELNLGRHALQEQEDAARWGRRIGLGLTGLADMYAALGIRYDSKEALDLTEKVMFTKMEAEYNASIDLAIERGSFELYDPKKHFERGFCASLPENIKERGRKYGLRNVAISTVAPNGSLSIIAQCSSGIEPIFCFSYQRFVEMGAERRSFTVKHQGLTRYCVEKGEEAVLPNYWVAAHEIDYKHRVKLQGLIQRYIDASISSCLLADGTNFIFTDSGIIPIEKFFNEKDTSSTKKFVDLKFSSNTINSDGKLARISEGYVNGVSKVYKIECQNDYQISCTPNHKLMILDKNCNLIWKQAEDIKVGDYIASRIGLNIWNKNSGDAISTLLGEKFNYEYNTNAKKIKIPIRMSIDLARLLGYLCSDAGRNVNGVFLSQTPNNVCVDFKKRIKKVFGIKCGKEQIDNRSKSGLKSIPTNSRVLSKYLEYLGVKNHDIVEVPPIILRSGSKSVKEFICGMTLDGHVSKDALIIATSVSKKYLKVAQLLLSNLGINARIHVASKEGERIFPGGNLSKTKNSWALSVCGQHASIFTHSVGFAEQKKQKLAEKFFKKPKRLYLEGDVPSANFRTKFRSDILPEIKTEKLYDWFHSLTCSYSDKRCDISRETLSLMSDVGMDIPDYLLDKTYIFRRVVKKSNNKGETFDLSVPNGNSYIVNGMISHNTINLPADVSEEVVGQIYIDAWKEGLKGITVYREGSREGVLVTDEFANQAGVPMMDTSISCVRAEGGDKFYVFVSYKDHNIKKPYQVFVLNYKKGDKESFIKTSNALISMLREKGVEEERIEKYSERSNNSLAKLTRFISLSMKTGNLVECVNILDRYAFAGTLVAKLHEILRVSVEAGKTKCPSCGSENLRMEEGCSVCQDCGFSGCG